MIPIQTEIKMNKLEKRYAWELELRKMSGEIIDYRCKPIGLNLAPRLKCYYYPDFLVVYRDYFEFDETKGGFCRDDALVKIKVAASLFPWFRFKMITWTKKQWIIREFKI